MVGKDSSSDAPKDEVGLNAFKPENPVVWGCNDGAEVAVVDPVG